MLVETAKRLQAAKSGNAACNQGHPYGSVRTA